LLLGNKNLLAFLNTSGAGLVLGMAQSVNGHELQCITLSLLVTGQAFLAFLFFPKSGKLSTHIICLHLIHFMEPIALSRSLC
jgi:hypothetical protein